MKWIDSTDISSWANRRDCQETLPLLVRKLIRATSGSIKNIKFPAGDNVLIGGWDGILELSEESEYLPLGTSLWEFGANKDVKGKADDDYEKRTLNPLGYTPEDSTYIFVTPRLWSKNNDWVEEKKLEGKWKDIKVINAEVLEEWIDEAPTVGAWFARHIGKLPSNGIQSTDDFWEEWSTGIKFNLNADILLGGRELAKSNVEKALDTPSIQSVKGLSREESLAFIISCFKSNLDKEEDFFSRSIIVDSLDAFRELSNTNNPLIIIPRIEDNGLFNRAVQNGHTIIIPLGADNTSNWGNRIDLPLIDRDSFVTALVDSGVTKEFAERYSKESARNITILRRQLEFTRNKPNWSASENVRDLIPALIVGRWNENYESDKQILAKISGSTYDEYIKQLSKWLYSSDSPVIKIGSTWRLTSPFDAWTNASIYLTKADFEMLSNTTLEVLSEINPAFELEPDQRYMASFLGKTREYSEWLREGVVQSLILTSILGCELNFDLPIKANNWVDNIISEFLKSEDPIVWKSFESKLPLIAEASPNAFLNAVEKLLSIDNSPILSLFEEDKGFISPNAYHTGLLWALEGLSWFPEYLSRASLILSKLASVDPGGSLSNRPINSLIEIFKPWHYQTLCSFEERIEVLKLIAKKQPDIGWELLIKMLPDAMGGVASPTNKTRWRMYHLSTENAVTYQEIYDTHSTAIELLMTLCDNQEQKMAKLVDESDKLFPKDREKVLEFVESKVGEIEHHQHSIWHTARKTLYEHRSHPDARWALPEEMLGGYESLYNLLMPTDNFSKTKWLFDDYQVQLPKGYRYKTDKGEYQNEIKQIRIDAVRGYYEEQGLKGVFELQESVNQVGILGEIAGFVIDIEGDVYKICEQLNETPNNYFIQNFISSKYYQYKFDWIIELFEKLKEKDFSSYSLSCLLIPIPQTKELWNFIEGTNETIKEYYWKNIHPHFYNIEAQDKIYGLEQLLHVKRFISAIDIASHYSNNIPSDLLVSILLKAGTEKSEEKKGFDSHDITRLFEELDLREDIDEDSIFRLEWIYLPLLASYGSPRKPKRLHAEMAKNPEFFVDVLRWAYKPTDDSEEQEIDESLTVEQIQNRGKQAFELLQSWKRIPGINDEGAVDFNFLSDWIEKVRDIAVAKRRLEVSESFIGKVLAYFPEPENGQWPSDEICEIIDSLNSERLNRSFRAEIFNKNGSTTRGAFDGGDIEWNKAKHFNNLAGLIRNKYPVVANIFEILANGYEEDAKRMDEQAKRDRLDY